MYTSTTPTKHCLMYVQTLLRRKLLWCPGCDYLYSDHVPVDWYDALGWWSRTDELFSHAIYFGHSKWIYHSIIITKNSLFRTCIFAVASVCEVFVTTSRHQAKLFCHESRFGISKHFFELGLYEILECINNYIHRFHGKSFGWIITDHMQPCCIYLSNTNY